MKFLQPFISTILALSFAAAGAVGLSPVLHRWVEHGGNVPAHIHYLAGVKGVTTAVRHDHANPVRQLPPERLHPAVLVRGHDTPSQPGVFLARLWRALNKSCAGDSPATDSHPTAPGQSDHQHQSLPQLLASGLVDQSFTFPPLPPPPAIVAFQSPAADQPIIPAGWNAQTATRGPPVALS